MAVSCHSQVTADMHGGISHGGGDGGGDGGQQAEDAAAKGCTRLCTTEDEKNCP
jgi:hypothetical protein